MTRRMTFRTVMVTVIVVTAVYSQTPMQPTDAGKPQITESGAISGNVYTNGLLGLSYEFPRDWGVDRAAMDYENARANRPQPKDPKMKEVFPLRNDGYVLLEVAKQASDTTRHADPPIIRLMADRLTAKSPTLEELTAFIKKQQHGTSQVVGEEKVCSFGGQTFRRVDVARTSLASPNEWRTTFVGYVVGEKNGFGLTFVIAANSLEQLNELVGTLNSLRFAGQ